MNIYRGKSREQIADQYQGFEAAQAAQVRFGRGLVLSREQWGLHSATDAPSVTQWLQAGAPINGVSRIEYGDGLEHWEVPLLTALIDGHVEAAETLIARGADVDSANAVFFPGALGSFSHTALHMVAQRGDIEGASMLIAAGSDVNRQTTLGTTPLHLAAGKDNAELVAMLLSAGADPNIREFDDARPHGLGDLPIDQAGERTRSLLRSTAQRGAHPETPVGDDALRGALHSGKTPLMVWAAVGDSQRVRELLAQGADVNAQDDDGDGVLRYALGPRNTEILQLLLSHGADPNSPSTAASGEPGFTILHAVAGAGWVDGIKVLVDSGAAIEGRGVGGTTPLMLAAGGGQSSSVLALQALGAKLDATDADGDSALFYAASNGQVDAVNTFLKLGANANLVPNTGGHTPLTVAAQMASPIGPAPTRATSAEYVTILVALARAGADISHMYRNGYVLWGGTPTGMGYGYVHAAKLRPLLDIASPEDWSVAYVSEEHRAQFVSTQAVAPQQLTSSPPSRQPKPTVTITVVGYRESFVVNSQVKVYWQGAEVGRVGRDGRFGFDITTDGEVIFRCNLRSAKVDLKATRDTSIYLSWDRTWGRLIASTSDPAILRSGWVAE